MKRTFLNMMPGGICLAAFFAGAWAVLMKYHHLSYFDWDLAFFSQAAWNLCHGSQYVSLVDINYFGDHSYYFTFLILPVFAILPHPLTLVFLKLAAFVFSAYLLFRILRRDHPPWAAGIFMILYLTFPANIFAVLYEFNPEAFAPVFLFLVYDYFQREKYKAFVIAAFFLCLIKENILLIVFMFGLYALIVRKKDLVKWGWLPMLVSSAVFSALVFWFIPLFRQTEQHAFWVRYRHLLEHPLVFLSMVVTENVGYIMDLFGPFLLPVILAPQNLFFAIPVFAQHLFSNEVAEHTIFYHYNFSLTPFIFLAAGAGLLTVSRFFKGTLYKAFILLLVVLSCWHIHHFVPAMKKRFIVREDHQDVIRWRMLKAIPPDEGVVATFDFLAPLSTRKSLYSLHMVYHDSFQDLNVMRKSELSNKRIFKLPDEVKYALIDLTDPVMVRALRDNPEVISKRLEIFSTWNVLDRQDSIVLLKRPPKE